MFDAVVSIGVIHCFRSDMLDAVVSIGVIHCFR